MSAVSGSMIFDAIALQEAVNSADNSHLISVPAGTILTDELYQTPIFGFGAGGLGGDEAGGDAGPGGIGVISSSLFQFLAIQICNLRSMPIVISLPILFFSLGYLQNVLERNFHGVNQAQSELL